MATVAAATQFDPAKLKVRRKALIRDLRRRTLALNSDQGRTGRRLGFDRRTGEFFKCAPFPLGADG